MPIKTDLHQIKGIQKDFSVSKAANEFAFDSMNIRLTARDGNTLLSVTNEKGNRELDIIMGDSPIFIEGDIIGSTTLNNYIILFTVGEVDRIYRLEYKQSHFEAIILYDKTKLGFDIQHPIECIALYENEKVQKVYWVDGLNPPRLINIVSEKMDNWNETSFNFTPTTLLQESFSVEKLTNTNGVFAPGVIQYVFNYYNQYGQESAIIQSSSIYYVSYNNRGASPEDKVSNAFKITISNLDSNFDYVRIFSIHRSSLNTTPNTKRVIDLHINKSSREVTFIDTGNIGETIDPTELLYKGGEDLIASTITHKDNTLFLGNIKLNKVLIDNDIRNYFRSNPNISFNTERRILMDAPSGSYYYESQLGLSSKDIRTFKYLEWYRFGVQFQHKTGKWSEPVFIQDKQNDKHIESSYVNSYYSTDYNIKMPYAQYYFTDQSIISKLKDAGFINVRPVIVYPEISDRECLCQGILCPTVYNVGDRYDNSPFAQSSWFTRPNSPFDIDKSRGIPIYTFSGLDLSVDSLQDKEELYIYSYETIYDDEGGSTINFSLEATLYIHAYHSADGKITKLALKDKDAAEGHNPDIPSEGYISLSKNNFYSGSYYSKYSASYDYDYNDRDRPFLVSINSRYGVINNQSHLLSQGTEEYELFDFSNLGTWSEFRHDFPIPKSTDRNAEIQSIYDTVPPQLEESDEVNSWVSVNSHRFYVDQSIVTLHSPELEFDDAYQNLNTTQLKLRIVGAVPLTGFVGDIDIQTTTPPNNFINSGLMAPGFYKEPFKASNISRFGWRNLSTGVFWFDELSDTKGENTGKLSYGFAVYPWHRNGSLNNAKTVKDETKSAMLKTKKLSNLRYSVNTHYLSQSEIWNAYVEDDSYRTGISGVSIFNSEEMSLVKIPAPKYSSLEDINYYGNIDKVLTIPNIVQEEYTNVGYPIVISGVQDASLDSHKLFYSPLYILDDTYTNTTRSTDPISMKYKSTPHAAIALNYSKDGNVRVLPTIMDGDLDIVNPSKYWKINSVDGLSYKPFWSDNTISISQDTLTINFPQSSQTGAGIEYGFLWMAELYNDDVQNRFGGDSEEAFENNVWVPCGDSVSLDEDIIAIKWVEGDTYYQRYDHLKTYPYTLEDQNSIVDIISFMCETRVNLDGRYDKNRGQSNNTYMTPINFNKINMAYSQRDNFFTYRSINHDVFNIDRFPTTITWSKEKFLGELVDNWSHITMASTQELDGDKGEITSLNVFNNEIFCFQQTGLSNILFNSRVQIPTSDGVPIEITNGLKVQGKRYISNTIGCNNKWSIVESPAGLYFIDNTTESIYLFDGSIKSLSDNLGFSNWLKDNNKFSIWNPQEFDNFISYYDRANNDVYFVNKDTCLCYSEIIGQFTSFMSYNNIFPMINVTNNLFSCKGGKLWKHFDGDYNMFYGEYKPYSITFISNPEPLYDKIFNNIEFRSDSWSDDELINSTFDTLEVWNEYQYGISNLVDNKNQPSPLKRKFRIWRANIPRDSSNYRDRIRNTWAYIKLSMNKPNTHKTVFHDLMVHYFL